jgi:acyl-CoA synthetase (AMP-forming)/AMP-acid ligase II
VQIGALIRRAALHFGDAPCLVEGERVLSFREFDALTDRLGNALLVEGLEPGDRVGVLLPNGIECLVAYYALAKSGLVRVSLNTRETFENHAYKLADSESRAVLHAGVDGLPVPMAIGISRLADMMASGPAGACAIDRDLDAPYRLGYTGGTTGRSKGVTLTMRGELAELSAFLTDLTPDIRPTDTFLHADRACVGRLLPALPGAGRALARDREIRSRDIRPTGGARTRRSDVPGADDARDGARGAVDRQRALLVAPDRLRRLADRAVAAA